MTKVQFYSDEWYPVHQIQTESFVSFYKTVELDEELVKRWQAGIEAFRQLQYEIWEVAKAHGVDL